MNAARNVTEDLHDGRAAQVVGGTHLADYDLESLAARLANAGGAPLSRAERAAASAIRLALGRGGLGREPSASRWTSAELSAAGIGRWAHDALIGLELAPSLEVVDRVDASDSTVRWLFRAEDGALVESVIIPSTLDRARPRTTICVSSQVGCGRGCRFCESGRHGLQRHLESREIVDQVRLMERGWAPSRERASFDNVVFMGMGEPFDNLPRVLRAVRLLLEPRAFAFAPSRVTVSTVGIADRFEAFFRGSRAEIAVSLAAPDDARRRAVVPGARFDLATIRSALLAAMPPGRRALFQYALFEGFNDAPEDADLLAEYVRPVHCRVNVIAGNPGPDPTLRAPEPSHVEAFADRLRLAGVTTIIRRARGRDVGAACGQLAGAHRRREEAVSCS